ncbi:MAG: hypothetical protein U5J78_00645 [Parasphingorhabdus sp.]|nr:hypothetical protein [Parasphingorhabdus sp.]
MQSLDASFIGGSVTDAGTFGLDVDITPTLSVGTSATLGRTYSTGKAEQSLTL